MTDQIISPENNIAKNFAVVCMIVICSAIACYPLAHSGFYMGHDWNLELTRAADYADGLKNGGFPLRWSQNLEGGYGSPIYNFFPPLSMLLFSVPVLLGVPLALSIKIVLFMLTITGGIGMYLFAKRHFGILGGALSGCIYVLAPYHFVEIFKRNAFAEFMALCIVPFVFYGLALTIQEERPGRGAQSILILSLSLFVLSHVLSVLMYAPLIIVYFLTGVLVSRRSSVFFHVGIPITIAACMVSFFSIPMMLETRYIQTEQLTLGKFDVLNNFVTLPFLLSERTWLSVTAYAPFLLILVIIVTIIKWKELNRSNKLVISVFAMMFFLSVFMMTPASASIWQLSELLRKFQFPWRLLSPAAFILSFLSGSILLIGGSWIRKTVVAGSVVMLGAWALLYYHPTYEGFYTATGELTADVIRNGRLKATVLDEYLPVWAVQGLRDVPTSGLVSSEPSARIELHEKALSFSASMLNSRSTPLSGSILTTFRAGIFM